MASTNTVYGLHNYSKDAMRETVRARVAGHTSAESAYHVNAHCYPRFERQKIRALKDRELFSGTRVPDPAFLTSSIPRMARECPSTATASDAGSVRSRGSVRSKSSRGSMHSFRRAGSEISERRPATGGSSASQNPYAPHFATTSRDYGGRHLDAYPANAVPWQGRGRDMWTLQRGGGQLGSYDNQLTRQLRNGGVRGDP
mmetsp:Transcript_34639/g.83653  ORF Transcript_34639/g.83653 Transcript_34639/m.83653 type:complete len:200 (-) Transcript_34639:144-743(-)